MTQLLKLPAFLIFVIVIAAATYNNVGSESDFTLHITAKISTAGAYSCKNIAILCFSNAASVSMMELIRKAT